MARPRKPGDRYPSGRLRPEAAPPALIRRAIDQALRGAADPLLGTELGRLRLTEVIDSEQTAAGERLGEMAAAVDRIDGIPRRSPASPGYERGIGRGGGGDESRSPARIRERYLEALACMSPAGRAAVLEVVVYGRPVVTGSHGDLRAALTRLAMHFGLTRAPNRAQTAETP